MTADLWQAPLSTDPFRGLGVRPALSSRRREYRPKPFDPGQPITWTRTTGGHWTEPPSPVNIYGQREHGIWVPPETVERTGTIWSAGPVPSSLWVVPDDAAGTAVAVHLGTKREPGPHELSFWPVTWQHDALRRAEHVRACGSIYAAVDDVREVTGYRGRPARTEETLTYHADPSCPDAAGKDRRPGMDGYLGYTVDTVVDILTGRGSPASPPPFCQRCIYLSEPGTTGNPPGGHARAQAR
jgi:hypothetical protein